MLYIRLLYLQYCNFVVLSLLVKAPDNKRVSAPGMRALHDYFMPSLLLPYMAIIARASLAKLFYFGKKITPHKANLRRSSSI